MEAEGIVLVLFTEGPNEQAVCRARWIANLLGKESILEVVDIREESDLVEEVGVSSTPLLVRISPAPRRKVAGHLDNLQAIAAYLGAKANWDDSSHE